MNALRYISRLSYGERVFFIGTDQDPKSGSQCTIIGVLPNPSRRPQHQWYDVRFDDGSVARFLEKYLRPAPAASQSGAA